MAEFSISPLAAVLRGRLEAVRMQLADVDELWAEELWPVDRSRVGALR